MALALRVCDDLGVERGVALQGMWAAKPDPGAMTAHEMDFFGRRINFVNGFAANDPESTERIWNMALERYRGRRAADRHVQLPRRPARSLAAAGTRSSSTGRRPTTMC